MSSEGLETRLQLSGSIFIVNSTADPGDGIPNAAETTLREAIQAANSTPNSGSPDQIVFSIPPADPGHLYYRNDGQSGTVSTSQIAVTSVPDDAWLTDADPDWPHSWYSIRATYAMTTITEAVVLDGYSQSGALANTLTVGSDAVLRIELQGSSAGSNAMGLKLQGAGSEVRGLVVNRFQGSLAQDTGFGIYLNQSSGNVIAGNYIGTDVSGTVDLGNATDGIYLRGSANNRIGGTAPSDRNVVSGNNSHGVDFFLSSSQNNLVQGNYLGVTARGDAGLGNSGSGVALQGGALQNTIGGAAPGAGNVISANGTGISLAGFGGSHVIQGNYIGTDATGSADLGNSNNGIRIEQAGNTIGGTVPGARNVISGNNGHGVWMSGTAATSNAVLGNWIGTTVAGDAPLGNGGAGVQLVSGAAGNWIGGTAPGAGNLLAANGRGVLIQQASGNHVQGNWIGTQFDGVSPLGNTYFGIQITDADNNEIGGTGSGAGNAIAFNGWDGVFISSGVAGRGNSILSNRIQSNGGLGIDLSPDGVTPNDPGDGDSGPNNLQNFPLLTSVMSSGLSTTVEGSINSTPNTNLLLQFFSSPQSDPTGFGEGKTYLGSVSVTTDAGGDASFVASLPMTLPTGESFVTATATDPAGNTSEFSAAITATTAMTDFGDAPESYGTSASNNGAYHLLGGALYLGSTVDGEADGQPSASADGDDTSGVDDEDGVVFSGPLTAGMMASVVVTASQAGLLAGWIDFNRDGDWGDAGEQVFVNRSLTAGPNSLSFSVPATAVPGDSFARFRVSTQSNLPLGGVAPDGEVEDHPIVIVDNRLFDFGDAPASYATLLADDGARHAVLPTVRLGASIDSEDDGLPSLAADGDDLDANDDEDGVVFTSPLLVGETATITVFASVAGWLSGWVDFDGDGDFGDAGEQVFADQAVDQGDNVLEFLVSATALAGDSYARFRFSTHSGLGYSGPADDGEVEDYTVRIQKPSEIHGSKWDDLDADGVRDAGEPGLAGWTIFIDQDDDGVLDVGERSTLTDANGDYALTALEPGSYVVAETLQAGWEQTYPSLARGEEFQVNTETEGSQDRVAIARSPSGRYVIVWTTANQRVSARIYSAGGVPMGDEFQVNTAVADTFGWDPAAAMDADGNFVVVWGAPDGDRVGVFARLFAADGTPQGDEFQVNTETAAAQIHPAVAMAVSGEFVVTWFTYDHDNAVSQVYAQRYTADGTAAGAEFRVNSGATTTTYPHPTVAMDGAGNFVAAWEGRGNDGSAIYARRFAADGAALSDDFQLNSIDNGSRADPAIAMRESGEFVMAWKGTSNNEVGADIFAQRFLADGTAVGAEFVVNAHLQGSQLSPSISVNGQGEFVISWIDGGDGAGWVQRYSAEGVAVGRPFKANGRGDVKLALSDSGEILATWYANTGAAGIEVFARSFGMSATQRIVLGEDEVLEGVDFGNFQPAEIHGAKWEDLDGDGVIEAGEPPVGAWRVYLDYDLDNWPDTDEPSTLTDSAGNYRFLHLLPGRYTVAEVSREGWRETFPGPAGQAGGFYGWYDPGDHLYFVDATGTVTDLPSAANQPEISGLAFDSADGILYGSSTAGELWTLDLTSGAAALVGILPITIERGLAYSPLDDLLYSVSDTGELIQIDPTQLTAAVVSGPGPGFGAQGLAFNPVDNRLYAFDSTRFQVYSYDATNFAGPILHANPQLIWNLLPDSGLTHDGTNLVMLSREFGNDVSLDLFSYDPDTGATSSLFSNFLFDVETGTTGLEFVPGAGGGAGTYERDLQAGQIASGHDFANYFYFSTISGLKYEDANENGQRDVGEAGLSSFVIYVDLDDDGVHDVDEPFDITLRGEFSIAADLPAGTYHIREGARNGWVQTEPASGFYTIDAFEGSRATGLLFGNRKNIDFGDAPDPTYPTLAASNGASHKIRPGFHLGAGVDHETDGQPAALADGDDGNGNDDEDGVEFLSHFARGYEAAMRVTASMAGRLDAWFDWNGDGDWDDAGEQVFDHRDLAAGDNVLSVSVPTFAVDNFARFRFSSFGVRSYDGPAQDGEVEDYAVQVTDLPPRIDINVVDFSTVGVGGFDRFQIVYDIAGGYAAPFDFSFYDSADARFDLGDMMRGSVRSIVEPEDRTAGRHTVVFDAAEYGAFLANSQTNFFLVVADATGVVSDVDYANNDLNFVGVFHAGSPSAPAPLVIRGRDDGDRYLDDPDDLIQFQLVGMNLALSGSLVSATSVFPLANISRVVGIGAGGDDRFDASGTSPQDLRFELNLGSGNDRVDLMLSGLSPDPGGLELNVAAGLGDDEVHLTASAFSDIDFDLDLGGGNDLVTVEIPIDTLSIPGKVRELQGRIRGGDGNDVAQSCIPMSFFDVQLDWDLGEGNDRGELAIEVAGQIVPAGESRLFQADLVGGTGDDILLTTVMGATSPPPPPNSQGFFDVVLHLDLGDGADEAMFIAPLDPTGIAGKVREMQLFVDGGAGDDLVQDCEPATDAWRGLVSVDLGEGNDQLMIEQQAVASGSGGSDGFFAIDVWGGAGNDLIELSIQTASLALPGKVRELQAQVMTGAGDDRLIVHANAVATAGLEVDLGSGDNAADLRCTGGSFAFPTAITLQLASGLDDDTWEVVVAGFDAVTAQSVLGDGDDQFTFVIDPDLPLPPHPTSFLSFILNVGAGLDGVVLDVEHVTIEEVLLGIFVQGVGLLTIEALFPLGALNMAQQVRDSRTASQVELAVEQVGVDLAIDVTTGAADDWLTLDIDPAADGSVRFSAATFDGEDDVRLTIPNVEDTWVHVDLGGGDDSATVVAGSSLSPDPTGKVRELQFSMLGGDGDDVVVIDVSARPTDTVVIDADGGRGDDLVRVDFREGAMGKPPARKRHLHVRGGDGNDFLVLHASIPSFRSHVDLLVDGGDGLDTAWVTPNVRVIACEQFWKRERRY